MVQRQSQALAAPSMDAAQITQYSGPYARPDLSGFTGVVGDDSGRRQLLQNLLGTVQGLAEQGWQRTQEEAYMSGVSQSLRGTSKKALESDPLTRAWTKAGFRDTMGRMSLAQTQADIQANMGKYQELDPDQFQEVLIGKRKAMLDTLEGMSLEQRRAALGKLVLFEQNAVAQHTKAHAGWIAGIEQRSIADGMHTGFLALDATRQQALVQGGDASAYQTAVESLAGGIVGDIWLNNRLETSTKEKLTVEAIQAALSRDHLAVYDFADTVELPDGQGTLMSRLPLSEQEKLSTAARNARKRNTLGRDMQTHRAFADLNARVDAGGEDMPTEEDFMALVAWDQSQGGNAISAAALRGSLEKLHRATLNQASSAAVVQAAQTGNVASLRQQGKTEQQGVDALVEYMYSRGANHIEVMASLLDAGSKGLSAAYKGVGRVAVPAIRQLINSDGEIDADAAAVATAFYSGWQSARETGHGATYDQVLDNMSPEDRLMVLRLREALGSERNAGVTAFALENVRRMEAADAGVSPGAAAARVQKKLTEVEGLFDSEGAQGFFTRFGRYFSSMVSEDSRNLYNAAVNGRVWGDPILRSNEAVNEQLYQFQLEGIQAAHAIALVNPGMSADSIYSAALADVASRTISTRYGNLYVPRGQTISSSLNLGAEYSWAGPEIIGNTLQSLVGASDAGRAHGTNRTVLSMDRNMIRVTPFDEDGAVMAPWYITGDTVKRELDVVRGAETQAAEEAVGAGRQFVGTGPAAGVSFRYSGRNTAGADPAAMLAFRANLIEQEGPRKRQYRDTEGVRTFGVGLSERNDYWIEAPEKAEYSNEQIQRTFMLASNAAAKIAVQNLQGSALENNSAAFQLVAEGAYQSGSGGVREANFQRMLRGIAAGNREEALAGLAGTRVWRASKWKRHQHYIGLVDQALGETRRSSAGQVVPR